MCLVKNSILFFLFKLYPFGLAYNDTSLPSSDDGHSSLIRLSEDFVFYNKKSRIVYVSMCVYTCLCTCIISVYLVYICNYVCIYVRIYTLTCLHTYVYTYVYANTCIDVLYICFYEQMQPCQLIHQYFIPPKIFLHIALDKLYVRMYVCNPTVTVADYQN